MSRSFPRESMKCFLCSQPGHEAVNCPKGKPCHFSPRKPWSHRHEDENYCIAVERVNHLCSDKSIMKCGCKFSVVGCLCSHTYPHLPVMQSHLNEKPVVVLRDTGRSGIVVRRYLVHPDQFTDQKKILVMLDCSIISVPVARC